VEEVGTLLVEGGEIGAQGAEGFEACLGTKAAGDFLFDLGCQVPSVYRHA